MKLRIILIVSLLAVWGFSGIVRGAFEWRGGLAEATAAVLERGNGTSVFEEVYGEITGITPTAINLTEPGKSSVFAMTPETEIFCNGLPAVWRSLLPVTAVSFFEAKVLLDACGRVVAVYGFYQGETCVLKGWRYKPDGSLEVELTAADSGMSCWRPVTRGASLPQSEWLFVDTEVYALYNVEGAVRGIFLPDY